MAFVLDASVALSWYFEDGVSDYADAVLGALSEDAAVVPSIWPLEIANALLTGQRRGRLSAAEVSQAFTLILGLPISLHDVPLSLAFGSIAGLAAAQHLTAYDAAYLDLAMRQGLSLATQDENLRAAADRMGVQSFLPT
jgi:predicted nucleic acid-binding protein